MSLINIYLRKIIIRNPISLCGDFKHLQNKSDYKKRIFKKDWYKKSNTKIPFDKTFQIINLNGFELISMNFDT